MHEVRLKVTMLYITCCIKRHLLRHLHDQAPKHHPLLLRFSVIQSLFFVQLPINVQNCPVPEFVHNNSYNIDIKYSSNGFNPYITVADDVSSLGFLILLKTLTQVLFISHMSGWSECWGAEFRKNRWGDTAHQHGS